MVYPIDYDQYTTDEIIELVEFLSMVEDYHEDRQSIDVAAFLEKYTRYRSILNNASEEKRIDQAFEKQTGHSPYKTMQQVKKSA